jgi:hypothetical protein
VARGIDVLSFEPDRRVMAVMGWNPMNPRIAAAVADAAYRSTLERLHRGNTADAVRLLVGA